MEMLIRIVVWATTTPVKLTKPMANDRPITSLLNLIHIS